MASGGFSLGTDGKLTGWLVWESAAYGPGENASAVSVRLRVARSTGSAYTTTGTFKGSIRIQDSTFNFSVRKSCSTEFVDVFSHTIGVPHDEDGKCSCVVGGTITGPTGTSMEGCKVSAKKTVTLDTISSGATITSAPNFTDEDNPTITYYNYSGDSASSLDAYITVGGKTIVPSRPISKTGKRYTFELTDAEREALRAATPNSNSLSVMFWLKTFTPLSNGDERLTLNKAGATMTIVNAAPKGAATVKDSNPATVAVTGSALTLVKYHSNAVVVGSAQAKKGATLVSTSISHGGKVYNVPQDSTTGEYQVDIGPVECTGFKLTITDSRGNATVTDAPARTFVEYTKLSCNTGDERPDIDGNYTLRASGNYFNDWIGKTRNYVTVQYRHKAQGGEWGEWVTIPHTITGHSYKAEVQLTGLDYRLTHVFQVKATDALCECLSAERTVRVFPLFDWSDTDFKFNIPVYDQDGNLLGGGSGSNPYPVGSYYIADNDTSPASLFGGSWERLSNCFLWGVPSGSTLGDTGGESTVTLTVDQMPAHTHTTGRTKSGGSGSAIYVPATSGADSPVATSSVGGGAAHNNMPPYVTVAIWRRTA